MLYVDLFYNAILSAVNGHERPVGAHGHAFRVGSLGKVLNL